MVTYEALFEEAYVQFGILSRGGPSTGLHGASEGRIQQKNRSCATNYILI